MGDSTDLGPYLVPKEVADQVAKRGADMATFAVNLMIGTLDEENRRLCKELKTERQITKALSERVEEPDALRRRVAYLEDVIRWALGESPQVLLPFPGRGEDDGPYWWRKTLRELAELPDKEEK